MKDRIKITLEDDEVLLEQECPPAIVPVVISSGRHGVEAELYFSIYPEVLEFLKQNKENLFDDDSLGRLNKLVAPYLEERGYVREKQGTFRWYHSFAGYDKKKICTDLILPSTKKLPLRKLENKTSFDIAELRQ